MTDDDLTGLVGSVMPNGKFRCELVGNGGRLCGAMLQAKRRSIVSHRSSKHKPDSSYKRNQEAVKHDCGCGQTLDNFNQFVRHARTTHQFRGQSAVFKKLQCCSRHYPDFDGFFVHYTENHVAGVTKKKLADHLGIKVNGNDHLLMTAKEIQAAKQLVSTA